MTEIIRYIVYVAVDVGIPICIYVVAKEKQIEDAHFYTLLALAVSVWVEMSIEFIILRREVRKFSGISQRARQHGLQDDVEDILDYFEEDK